MTPILKLPEIIWSIWGSQNVSCLVIKVKKSQIYNLIRIYVTKSCTYMCKPILFESLFLR